MVEVYSSRSTGSGGNVNFPNRETGPRGQDYGDDIIPLTTVADDREDKIPITISNDGIPDGSDIIVFELDKTAPVGFSQETYIFSEPSDFLRETVDNVPVKPNSPIKTAIVIIKDSGSATTPISGEVFYGTTGNDSHRGGNADDVLLGSNGNDRLRGSKGNDILAGEDDKDTLYGGQGNDSLHGGYDNDILYGEQGDDSVNGGSGKDELHGNAGDDYLDGYDDDDLLFGEAGDDILDGWNDNDILDGGDGNDRLLGWFGDDKLNGGDGSDALFGEDENDTLNGGLGIDSLYGGSGDDTYIVDSTTDTITEYKDEGTDTVNSSISFTLGENLENLTLTGRSNINGTGNSLENTIIGNAGKNYLFGREGNDTLKGEAGDDILDGWEGDDILDGGAGNDRLLGAGNDSINSDDKDTLLGGAGADTFVFYYPLEGMDTIKDFNSFEGDKLEVSASGFGIEQGEFDKFRYQEGTLLFDSDGFSAGTAAVKLASLQPNLDFVESRDINIV